MQVAFIGHKKVKNEDEVIEKLKVVIENLIVNRNVTSFLFGSNSIFDSICYKVTSDLKDKYPFIKRTYVRCDYQEYPEFYQEHINKLYEESYFPERVLNAGKKRYVLRNQDMIDNSDIMVFYCDNNYKKEPYKESRRCVSLTYPRSGTHVAYEYAVKKKKEIINIFEIE